jgi:response regulator RpfG family c-di-GMP phosphodiesterase
MIEGSRILLVDDSPEVIRLLSDFLYPYKCDIFAASNGKETTDLLSRENIDIAVLDIKLPDTDGLTLLDAIKLHDPTIATVMITGYNDPDLIVDAMKKGASDFLIKPFSIDKLLLVMMRVKKQRELLLEKSSMLVDLEDKRKIEVLNRQLQTKIAELTKMYHISSNFSSVSIFEDIYEKTTGLINEVLNADLSGYYIVDHENRQLILYRSKTNGREYPIEATVSLNPELLDEMRTGKRYFVRNDKAYLSLVIKGEFVGALMMGCRRNGSARGRSFSEEDLYFLKFIADKASMQIENRMLYESLFESVLHTLTSLIVAINRRDMYTEGHCKRVAHMCLCLADRVGASEYEKDVVRVVAPIHDVGKVGIPDTILLKPDKLTDEEYVIMKNHSAFGEEIINRFDILLNEARITRHHHEFYDGRGYPDKLAEDAIPYCSRMISICDTYDAMTTDRPYRKGISKEEALVEIKRCKGKQFDPTLAECFIEMVNDGLWGG